MSKALIEARHTFSEYLMRFWNVEYDERGTRKTLGEHSLSLVNMSGNQENLGQILQRIFNYFPAHLDLTPFEKELFSINAEYLKLPDSKGEPDYSKLLPVHIQNRLRYLADRMWFASAMVLLDSSGKLKPSILQVLKIKYPQFDSWVKLIGEEKVTEALLHSYTHNIIFCNLKSKNDLNTVLCQKFAVLCRDRSPDLKNFNLIDEIDAFAMARYAETWGAIEGVLTSDDYKDSIQHVYKRKFFHANGEYNQTAKTKDKGVPSFNTLLPALKGYEATLAKEKVSDLDILSRSYGLNIVKEKEKERLSRRHGEEPHVFEGAACGYFSFNHAYTTWSDQQEEEKGRGVLPSHSAQIFGKIYRLNNVLVKFTEKLSDLDPKELNTILLNRIRNLQDAWLRIKSDYDIFRQDELGENRQLDEDYPLAKEMKFLYEQAIQNLQREQGKLQDLVYFDKRCAAAYTDNKEYFVDLLAKVLKLNPEQHAIFNLEDLVTTKKDELKTAQHNLLNKLASLARSDKAPHKSLQAELQPLIAKLQKACEKQITPISELLEIENWIKEHKPNPIVACWNSFISNFTGNKEVMGLQTHAWLRVLEEKVQSLKKVYQKQYFDSDVLQATQNFKEGKFSDIEFLTTLLKMVDKYQKALPERTVELNEFCGKFKGAISQNDLMLETTVIASPAVAFYIPRINMLYTDDDPDRLKTYRENYLECFQKSQRKTFIEEEQGQKLSSSELIQKLGLNKVNGRSILKFSAMGLPGPAVARIEKDIRDIEDFTTSLTVKVK